MISSDLKSVSKHTQKSSINNGTSNSLEARTNQLTTTYLQSSDLETSPKNPSPTNSDIERSKNLINIETKKKIEEIPQDIESHYYKQLLQAKREDLIQEQIFYLEKLSDLYLEKQNWVQAAKLLNCAVAISEKNLNDSSSLFTKLEKIEALFLESKGFKIPSQHNGSVLNHRAWLKNIRTLYAQKYQEKVPIQEIITFLTDSYRKLLGTLILESQEFLGNPCTQWACIGMGSMARGEMCPYSDLEFAFLVHYKTEEVLDYFRYLSKLLELRIINMGETKFPIFAQLFGEKSMEASPTPGGFSMDTGGNTPLGKPGFYELIDFPQGLARYQSIDWMETDIIVTNALSTTCLVVGDEKLFCAYTIAKEKALNKTDGLISFSGTPFRSKLALKLLKSNLQEYKPDLSKEKQKINAFGIKKELYRPLQSLVGTLALFCGLTPTSTFAMIQQLFQKGILSLKGAENLTRALSQILALRFEAHTFYQSEEEFLLHKEQEHPQDPRFLYLDEKYLKILHDIYMVLIPLQRCGEEFLETQELQLFAKSVFYDESPSVQGEAFSKTLQYTSAHNAFENAISLNPNDINVQMDLGLLELEMGRSKEALTRHIKALALAQKKHGEEHYDVAASYNNIGMAYEKLGEYHKALEFYQKGLKIQLLILEENHPIVASSYSNIGNVHDHLGNYELAFKFSQKALKIRILVYGKYHPAVATSYHNLGVIANSLTDINKALEYTQKALKIRIQIYGEDCPEIAGSYNNIGNVYNKYEGDYKKGLDYYQKALNIRLQFFDKNHPDIASSYSNIGLAYKNLKEQDKALEFYQKALKIWLEVFSENHPDVALCYSNIGSVYYDMQNDKKALEFCLMALKIRHQMLDKHHPDIASSYSSIGVLYMVFKDYDKALEFLQNALKIELQVYGKTHPKVATSYNNIGLLYKNLREFDKAIKFFLNDLKIQLRVRGENHPDLVQSYNNIGEIYLKLSNPNKALEFYEKALNITIRIPGKDNLDLARSFHNSGSVYEVLQNYDSALEHYQTSLYIRLLVLDKSHPDLGENYIDIGNIYHKLSNFNQALEFYEKSLNIKLLAIDKNHTALAYNYDNIGITHYNLGNYDKGFLFFLKAAEHILIAPKNESRIKWIMINLFNCATKVSSLDPIKDIQKLFGADHPISIQLEQLKK